MKKNSLLDTNVIIRFFVEDPQKVSSRFKGVFSFFRKIEADEITVELPELVVFEAFYVLTRLYHRSPMEVSKKLFELVSFKGIAMKEKHFMLTCLQILATQKIDLVDAYILACSERRGIEEVYSYDSDLARHGLKLLPIE